MDAPRLGPCKPSLVRSAALAAAAGVLTTTLFSLFDTGGESGGGTPKPNPE